MAAAASASPAPAAPRTSPCRRTCGAITTPARRTAAARAASPRSRPPGRPDARQNPNPQAETRRALFLHLVDWVTNDTPPPLQRYPRVTDGTLVAPTAAAMGWPDIPGAPTPDNVMNVLMDYDYGPDFRYNDQSGVMTNVVPPIKQIIPTLAAKVDEDGNEVAGVKSVLLQAPLGTYTSWNPVAAGRCRATKAVSPPATSPSR